MNISTPFAPIINRLINLRGASVKKDAQARLLETATSLFARKGFAAVSVRELAQAADVRSALITYHFGGKEGLYQAVLEAQFASIGEYLEQVRGLPSILSEEGLRLYVRRVVAVHRCSPYLQRFMTSELANPTVVLT